MWDEQLARFGADLLAARMVLVDRLRPLAGAAYAEVARGGHRDDLQLDYKPSLDLGRLGDVHPEGAGPDREALAAALTAAVEERRRET